MAQHTHPFLPLLTRPPSLQSIAAHHHMNNTPLWQTVNACTPPTRAAPPTHVLRYMCSALDAVNAWTGVSALAREPYHTPTAPWSDNNAELSSTSHILVCSPETPEHYQQSITSRHWILRNTALPPPHPAPVAYARFQTTTWFLYVSSTTLHTASSLQRLRLHCYFLNQHNSYSALWHPHPQREFLYESYTRGMRQALNAKDLGHWAELLQKRVDYLPYETHPIIRMLRAISRTHAWHTSVTPATALIYIAIHAHLLVCYAGRTTLATTQRLRKHVTTTQAGTKDSSFHDLSRNTTELHWTLVLVELVDSQQLACYGERSSWHRVQKWAADDTAPALPSNTAAVPAAQHTKQLQTTLCQAQIGCVNRDYAHAAILNKDVERIASRLNVPLCRPASVTVPYMTPIERSSIQQIVKRMIRHTQRSSWERLAIWARIRVIPSSPLTVHRAFERLANKHDKSTVRPACFCNIEHRRQGGTVSPG